MACTSKQAWWTVVAQTMHVTHFLALGLALQAHKEIARVFPPTFLNGYGVNRWEFDVVMLISTYRCFSI